MRARRIQAAHDAALLLATNNMWQEPSALLEGTVRMLPDLTSRSLRREDQEYRLSEFRNPIAESVSITFQAGSEAAHCLRLLELGQGIIIGLAIDSRADLSELRLKHPKEFDTLYRLRTQLDSTSIDGPTQANSPVQLGDPITSGESNNLEASYQHDLQVRLQAARELDGVLASIRELPGFEGFQLPPRSKDFMAMACEGPIVIVNSTTFRSGALIVTSSTIESLAENMAQIAKLIQGRRSTYQGRNQRMGEILLWLWNVAVKPTLKSLSLVTGLPRIWWIGVGPLAVAPFHDAGDHSRGSTHNTISQTISSYNPTIKALSYARQKNLELLRNAYLHLLLVTMPTTPGQSPLHNSTTEAADIANIVKGKAGTTQLEHPSTAQVLNELPSYHVIHFAYHGLSNPENHSDSHLLLCQDDGSESGTLAIDGLTVKTISNTKLQHAQIAYLSACSTAENSPTTLADESIYIASGFQLAGFSHVLATQWISNDSACREVAGDFNRILFNDQPGASYQGHRKVTVVPYMSNMNPCFNCGG